MILGRELCPCDTFVYIYSSGFAIAFLGTTLLQAGVVEEDNRWKKKKMQKEMWEKFKEVFIC